MFKFSELKKFFIFSFVGTLIVAALVAVVTVLMGQFNEVTWRVFATLFMVVAHSLVSLLFIWDDSKHNTFDRLAFFINTVFIIIILSFIASIFGIWKIVSGETIWHIYQTFFVIIFAALHVDVLSKATKKEKYMDAVIYANYGFILLVALLLLPIIYVVDAQHVLGEMYYRILAAVGIIDGTLSILTIIFYKLYMHKHPEAENVFTQSVPVKDGQPVKKGISIWLWILIIWLLFQLTVPFMMLLGSSLWR